MQRPLWRVLEKLKEATSESGIVNGVPFSVTAVTAVGVNPCDTIHGFSVEDA